MTPPQTFAVISMLLIAAMAVATSFTISTFYRKEIINRESMIVRNVVLALTLKKEASRSDMENFTDANARENLEHAFGTLKNLPGVQRIKAFNRDSVIAWSDEPNLIGTRLTSHQEDLALAMGGEVRVILGPDEKGFYPIETFPRMPLIEFYVPFSFSNSTAPNAAVDGVLALYRSPQELNDTLENGMLLLWSVTLLGGLILFAFLYRLYLSMYDRQRDAESQFATLSSEHERLVQLEKLSAIGQMVSEIAHQLNNPLVGVVNLAELAQRDTGNSEHVRELLEEIRKAGDHCRGFVQRMLRFNKVTHSDFQLVDLKELVQETIVFLQQSVAGNPNISLEAQDAPVLLEADPVLIRHALFNLIHNAALSKPGGPVVVSIALEQRKDVSGWRLTVSDFGPGLTPEAASKLFTPFFTTRPGGTGLGLTVAQHIVVQHGGSIHAENKQSGGARFTIWLPTTRQQHEK